VCPVAQPRSGFGLRPDSRKPAQLAAADPVQRNKKSKAVQFSQKARQTGTLSWSALFAAPFAVTSAGYFCPIFS
jgi:hypothetical protein